MIELLSYEILLLNPLEIYSKVPNPIVPMYLFKDVRGFLCMNIIGSMGGVIYVAMSIIWPSRRLSILTSGFGADCFQRL